MTPYFQYQPRVSYDACLVQIWGFQLKSVTSYRAEKVKFTDRQTDGRTDRQTDRQTQATTIPIRPERSRGKKLRQSLQACARTSDWSMCVLMPAIYKGGPS